jgi:hypothetical protein
MRLFPHGKKKNKIERPLSHLDDIEETPDESTEDVIKKLSLDGNKPESSGLEERSRSYGPTSSQVPLQ